MAQTLCIKCGSELEVSSYCQLCREPSIFACTSCDYITEEKVHTDCRNAEVLAKTTTTQEEVQSNSLRHTEERGTTRMDKYIRNMRAMNKRTAYEYNLRLTNFQEFVTNTYKTTLDNIITSPLVYTKKELSFVERKESADREIEELRVIMLKIIDKMLERSEGLILLEKRTEDLKVETFKLKNAAAATNKGCRC